MICFWVTDKIMLRCYHASQRSNTGLYSTSINNLKETTTTKNLWVTLGGLLWSVTKMCVCHFRDLELGYIIAASGWTLSPSLFISPVSLFSDFLANKNRSQLLCAVYITNEKHSVTSFRTTVKFYIFPAVYMYDMSHGWHVRCASVLLKNSKA